VKIKIIFISILIVSYIETQSQEKFALIIGNENYTESSIWQLNKDYAINDARAFKEYSIKTLGIPKENIIYVEDGTSLEINNCINKFIDFMSASPKENDFFVYYSGYGYLHEYRDTYIIPVDVDEYEMERGIKLNDFYSKLVKNNPKSVTIFIETTFCVDVYGSLLRGGIIPFKDEKLNGNIVVFTANSDNRVAIIDKEKKHGLFTFFLLKTLQESDGNISYNELIERVIYEVKLNSIVGYNKKQTPKVNVGADAQHTWREWQINKK